MTTSAMGGRGAAGLARSTLRAAAALSAAQALEMRLRGRPPSPTPGLVLARLTGRRLEGAAAVAGVHAAQGSLALTAATVAAVVPGSWGRRVLAGWVVSFNAAWMLDGALGVVEAPWRWSRGDLAADAANKLAMSAAAAW